MPEASETSTSLGGYGEVHVLGVTTGRDGKREWIADLPRLISFVAHELNDRFRSYIELEIEHALSCGTSCPGSTELEQAHVDWDPADRAFGLRGGLILVPMRSFDASGALNFSDATSPVATRIPSRTSGCWRGSPRGSTREGSSRRSRRADRTSRPP